MRMPRALAFDVFGTVVDWRSSIIGELEMFGERHGVAQDWAAFADAWRAGIRRPWIGCAAGTCRG